MWDTILIQNEKKATDIGMAEKCTQEECIRHIERIAFLAYGVHQLKDMDAHLKSKATDELLENIGKASTRRNIILWTKKQHRLFYLQEQKVLLTSGFGTGKTILLREKAIECAKNNPKLKVYFIIFMKNAYIKHKKVLVWLEAKDWFSEFPQIILLTWPDVKKDVADSLKHDGTPEDQILATFIRSHQYDTSGIFMDEFSTDLILEDHIFAVGNQLWAKIAKRYGWQLLEIMLPSGDRHLAIHLLCTIVLSHLLDMERVRQKAALDAMTNLFKVSCSCKKDMQSIVKMIETAEEIRVILPRAMALWKQLQSPNLLHKMSPAMLKRLLDHLMGFSFESKLQDIIANMPVSPLADFQQVLAKIGKAALAQFHDYDHDRQCRVLDAVVDTVQESECVRNWLATLAEAVQENRSLYTIMTILGLTLHHVLSSGNPPKISQEAFNKCMAEIDSKTLSDMYTSIPRARLHAIWQLLEPNVAFKSTTGDIVAMKVKMMNRLPTPGKGLLWIAMVPCQSHWAAEFPGFARPALPYNLRNTKEVAEYSGRSRYPQRSNPITGNIPSGLKLHGILFSFVASTSL